MAGQAAAAVLEVNRDGGLSLSFWCAWSWLMQKPGWALQLQREWMGAERREGRFDERPSANLPNIRDSRVSVNSARLRGCHEDACAVQVQV